MNIVIRVLIASWAVAAEVRSGRRQAPSSANYRPPNMLTMNEMSQSVFKSDITMDVVTWTSSQGGMIAHGDSVDEVGGCGGTEFGCCPEDGFTTCVDESCSNCEGVCVLHLRSYNNGLMPMIKMQAGTTLHVNYHSNLEDTSDANTVPINNIRLLNVSNLHTHGLHISPVAPSDDPLLAIPGQGSYDYTFVVDADHAPGTHWYHAHHHGGTMVHVMSGAVGLWIVEDDPLQTPAWIQAMPEFPMLMRVMIKGLMTPESLLITDPVWEEGQTDPCPEFFALVGSQVNPVITVENGGWYRLRLVNAGPMQHMAIIVPGECDMWLMALDWIYLSGPVYMPPTPTGEGADTSDTRPIFMAAGNRRDIALRCSNLGDESIKITVQSTGIYAKDPPFSGCNTQHFGDVGDTYEGDLFTIEVLPGALTGNNDVGPTVGQPTPWFSESYLRPAYLTDLQDEIVDGAYGENVFTTQNGNQINGRSWDPPAPEGTGIPTWIFPMQKTSEMMIAAMAGGGHPYHQHVMPFQVQESAVYNYTKVYGFNLVGEWMDTLASSEGCFMPVRFKPDRFEGHIIVHCHLLKHEDLGMMMYGNLGDSCDTPNPDICCMEYSTYSCGLGASQIYNTIAECVGQFDPWCVNVAWDAQCVSEAQEMCGLTCY